MKRQLFAKTKWRHNHVYVVLVTGECPTYLKMDMVILLDSSSSVGNENFEIQRGFTKKLIGLVIKLLILARKFIAT